MIFVSAVSIYKLGAFASTALKHCNNKFTHMLDGECECSNQAEKNSIETQSEGHP